MNPGVDSMLTQDPKNRFRSRPDATQGQNVAVRASERLEPVPPGPLGSRNQSWKCQMVPAWIEAGWLGGLGRSSARVILPNPSVCAAGPRRQV